MPAKKPWYVTKRADALAMVYLTGREDLEIQGPRPDEFPHFVVSQRTQEGRAGRFFGVEVEAQAGPLTNDEWEQMAKGKRRVAQTRGVGYPVCLFLIDTAANEARYLWLIAPLIEPSGAARLGLGTSELKSLTYSTINEIVENVARYYDALLVKAVA